MIALLADLEARAGASDQDRDAWLAMRRAGVTATEIRDLYLGARTAQDLIDIKLGRVPDPFVNTKYTVWGKLREPELADYALHYGAVEPESRVFRAADDPRKLASPDGVGVDPFGQLVLGEYKTSKYPIPLGSEKLRQKGYIAQMVWQMRVMGARSCLYVWEQHNDQWTRRVEGVEFAMPAGIVTLQADWVDYDEALAAELEQIADAFLAELDRQRDEGAPVVDEVLDTEAVNYLRGLDLERQAKELKEPSWEAMLRTLSERGEVFQQTSTLARITFKPAVVAEGEEPDVEAAKQADPGLFAEVQALSKRWNEHQARFKRQVSKPGRPTLRVTAVKTKGERP